MNRARDYVLAAADAAYRSTGRHVHHVAVARDIYEDMRNLPDVVALALHLTVPGKDGRTINVRRNDRLAPGYIVPMMPPTNSYNGQTAKGR